MERMEELVEKLGRWCMRTNDGSVKGANEGVGGEIGGVIRRKSWWNRWVGVGTDWGAVGRVDGTQASADGDVVRKFN